MKTFVVKLGYKIDFNSKKEPKFTLGRNSYNLDGTEIKHHINMTNIEGYLATTLKESILVTLFEKKDII